MLDKGPGVVVGQGRPLGKAFNFLLQGEKLPGNHTKTDHLSAPGSYSDRRAARLIANRECEYLDHWWPERPDSWPVERPMDPRVDDDIGEPIVVTEN